MACEIEELERTYDIFRNNGSSIVQTAEYLGINKTTVQRRLNNYQKITGVDWKESVVTGNVHGLQTKKIPLPKKGQVRKFIISSAQNNTHVHRDFFKNLEAYAEQLNATILISQFSYNKAAYGKKAIKPGTEPSKEDMADMWFDSALDDYVCNDRVYLAPNLMFCGESNILPTAVRPLSGFENYCGSGVSGIFPHTGIAMESVAAMSDEDVKHNYTTGSVTIKNYVKKKAGLKAEFHHCFGSLLVEVDHKGDYWVRQINATKDGSFYDLDYYVEGGVVTKGHRVEALNWGDVHVESVDPEILELNWGKGGIMDTLKPKYQFMHDVLDFYCRNHHRIGNQHAMFERHVEGKESVQSEMDDVNYFLSVTAHRDWCETIVVDSNHDNALERWLRESDYKKDHINAIFYLKTQLMKYMSIEEGNKDFHLVESVLQSIGVRDNIKFLRDNDSFIICGDIECGMHGHLGINGARGSAISFSKSGRKTNTGHTHSAQIVQGAYVAGTSSLKRMEYNKGLSSWSHSHIVTYPNGKRCIITVRNGKFKV